MAMAKPLPPISAIHCIQKDAAFSIRQFKMLCKENPRGNTEQSLKQKPYKSSNAEVRKPTGLRECGSCCGRDQNKSYRWFWATLSQLAVYLVCLLINLFHLVTLTILWFMSLCSFGARLASPPLNLSCHVILFSKGCHTLLVGPKCLRCCSSEIFELAVSGSYYSLHFHMKAAECHLLFFRSWFCLYLEIPNGAPWGCGLSDLCLYNRAALTYEVFAREPTLALCLLETKYDNFILHNLSSKKKKPKQKYDSHFAAQG